jgi:hypothetical protein
VFNDTSTTTMLNDGITNDDGAQEATALVGIRNASHCHQSLLGDLEKLILLKRGENSLLMERTRKQNRLHGRKYS